MTSSKKKRGKQRKAAKNFAAAIAANNNNIRGDGATVGGQSRSSGQRKSNSVNHSLKVSLEYLYNGRMMRIAINRQVIVGESKLCTVCNGRGENAAFQDIAFALPCWSCNGYGYHATREKKRKIVEVRVEKGMKQNDKILCRGMADEQPNKETGDVFFIIQEEEHDLFERKGDDLYVTQTLSLNEALRGFELCLKHLDGREIVIKTQPGEVIRAEINASHPFVKTVPNKGMPCHGNPLVNGNLHVYFSVEIPELTPVETQCIIECVRRGSGDMTNTLTRFGIAGLSFENSGVMSLLLDVLQRCEHDTFDKVVPRERGLFVSPSNWIKLITKASQLEPSCRLQIVQNIGPLVKCMCADTKRVFFKSNKHWREAIMHFVELIWYMYDRTINSEESNDTKLNIVGTLLKHEGLLRSIVQWGFWGEEHRPDISKELEDNKCTQIVEWGREMTSRIIHVVYDAYEYDDDYKEYQKIFGFDPLEIIATTPIVSKDYHPDCMISYVAGLIRLAKATNGDKDHLRQVECFALGTDCVDKEVITEMIDFGTNFVTNYSCASLTANITAAILVERLKLGSYPPSDTRVAFAIRSGLIEMCLSFIERWGHQHFERDDEYSQYQRVHDILIIVYKTSLHLKTAKAIRSKRNKIWEELVRLEQNTNITNNQNCKRLLDMVRSILNLNGAYCCRCNKPLGRRDVKRCNGCNRMTYCSIACQKKDWLNGHNVTCNKKFAVEQSGVFQGRCLPVIEPESERAAAKLESLEINITMIQLKLFLDNAETILNRARDLGIPLHDCAVLFDLSKCPPTVKTLSYNEAFRAPDMKRGFEGSRSKENITCLYWSNIYNGELDKNGGIPILKMQRFFPHEWLSKKVKKN